MISKGEMTTINCVDNIGSGLTHDISAYQKYIVGECNGTISRTLQLLGACSNS